MPLYDFRCGDGHLFERLLPLTETDPQQCPACGGTSVKVPSGAALLGRAQTGLSKDEMPQTWRGTYNGNREYLSTLRGQWASRQRLEAKYPEIAGDQRPILAHEGRYHGAPLRAGDVEVGTGSARPSHGHDHPHGHSHAHGHDHSHGHTPSSAAATATPPTPGP